MERRDRGQPQVVYNEHTVREMLDTNQMVCDDERGLDKAELEKTLIAHGGLTEDDIRNLKLRVLTTEERVESWDNRAAA